jgi:hypothetical protein
MQHMPSLGSFFTPLEAGVLNAIFEMNETDRILLEAQLSTATFVGRENTGAGFFTNFTVDRKSSAAIGGRRLRDGPAAKIAGLDHGMGFILWLKDGYADCLEGYCYGGSTSQIDLEKVGFEIVKV